MRTLEGNSDLLPSRLGIGFAFRFPVRGNEMGAISIAF